MTAGLAAPALSSSRASESKDGCAGLTGDTLTLFRRWGGGRGGILGVIGGTDMAMDADDVTPLKEGDVATTTTIENKVAINSRSYRKCEQQLFANMHLSATHALVDQLFDGSIKPSQVERMVAYGSILKPGFNSVALYKLVAPCNSETYVQVDYCVHTIYWHPFFDRILLYTFEKLSK